MLNSLPLLGLHTLAMIGMEPLIIVLVVVLVLFGGKKIPELMRGVGQGVGELQKGIEETKRTMSSHTSYTPPPTTLPEDPLEPKTPAATGVSDETKK